MSDDPQFSLNQSMIDLARTKAEQLANELQVNAVIVVIAHSGSEIAVGHANDANESVASIGGILRDVAENFRIKP